MYDDRYGVYCVRLFYADNPAERPFEAEWGKQLKVGDELDFLDTQGNWYDAEVLERKGDMLTIRQWMAGGTPFPMRFNETVRCDNAERLRKKMPSKEHYVFVDDQMLVVYYGLKSEVPSFVYGKCFESNEFWVSIIEKAVAKVHGGYVGIQEGQPPGCGLQL